MGCMTATYIGQTMKQESSVENEVYSRDACFHQFMLECVYTIPHASIIISSRARMLQVTKSQLLIVVVANGR